ncbi:MAG: hypothetical protein WBM57_17025, partial [Woeseiaceae bacterium]
PDTDGIAKAAWDNNLNCPVTSAAGRLFDAAAAIICEFPYASFEAQGPMMLEAMCRSTENGVRLALIEGEDGVLRTDWEPLLDRLADHSVDRVRRAEVFHASMALAILEQARAIAARHPVAQIGLCGGVFQNRVLAEQATAMLEQAGFDVFMPLALPCNDAGLSYGQAAEVAARERQQ